MNPDHLPKGLYIRTKPEGTGVPKVRAVHGMITVIVEDRKGNPRAIKAKVKWGATFTNGAKSLGWESLRSGGKHEGDVAVENRGVTWISGHHSPNSPEIAALISAYALTRS